MPLYTRHCGTCPTLFVVLSKMDERNDPVPCEQLNRLDAVVSQASEHEATMARFQSELTKADGERGLAIANTFPSQ